MDPFNWGGIPGPAIPKFAPTLQGTLVLSINGDVPPEGCYNPAGKLLSSLSAATNAAGGTVGLGTEFALTRNWSGKAEWDYTNFGSRNFVASDGTVMNSGVGLNEVKIGANYHFVP